MPVGVFQGREFARAAQGRNPGDTLLDQPVDVQVHAADVRIAVLIERRDARRHDAVRQCAGVTLFRLHGLSLLIVLIDRCELV